VSREVVWSVKANYYRKQRFALARGKLELKAEDLVFLPTRLSTMFFNATIRTMPLSDIVRYEQGKPPYGPLTAIWPILSIFLRGGECVQFAVHDLAGTVSALDSALAGQDSSS
jgi:hypothetical protein